MRYSNIGRGEWFYLCIECLPRSILLLALGIGMITTSIVIHLGDLPFIFHRNPSESVVLPWTCPIIASLQSKLALHRNTPMTLR